MCEVLCSQTSASAKLVVQKQSECSGVLCRLLTILGGCFIQKAVNGFHKDKDLPCDIALYFSVCASWILFYFSFIIQDFFFLDHLSSTYQASMCFYIKNGKWDYGVVLPELSEMRRVACSLCRVQVNQTCSVSPAMIQRLPNLCSRQQDKSPTGLLWGL